MSFVADRMDRLVILTHLQDVALVCSTCSGHKNHIVSGRLTPEHQCPGQNILAYLRGKYSQAQLTEAIDYTLGITGKEIGR